MTAAWAIILAAGAGSRFGGPKPLAPWQGGTLLSRAIAAAGDVCGDRVIVVTGGHAAAVTAACGVCRTQYNEDWQTGLGASIACGIRAVATLGAEMALLVPVDQPFIAPTHLRALADRAAREGRCVLSRDGAVTGPPAAVPDALFAELAVMTGEAGLKKMLAGYGVLDAPGILRDADTPAALARLEQAAPGPE